MLLRAIKAMLGALEREAPGRIASIFKSLRTVVPSHFADRRMYDSAQLRAGAAQPSKKAGAE